MSTIIFTGIPTELGVEIKCQRCIKQILSSIIVSGAVSSSLDKDVHVRSLQNMEIFLTVAS